VGAERADSCALCSFELRATSTMSAPPSKLRANLSKLKNKIIDTSALVQRHQELKQLAAATASENERLLAEKAATERQTALRIEAEAALQQKLETALTQSRQRESHVAALQARIADLEEALRKEQARATESLDDTVRLKLAQESAISQEMKAREHLSELNRRLEEVSKRERHMEDEREAWRRERSLMAAKLERSRRELVFATQLGACSPAGSVDEPREGSDLPQSVEKPELLKALREARKQRDAAFRECQILRERMEAHHVPSRENAVFGPTVQREGAVFDLSIRGHDTFPCSFGAQTELTSASPPSPRASPGPTPVGSVIPVVAARPALPEDAMHSTLSTAEHERRHPRPHIQPTMDSPRVPSPQREITDDDFCWSDSNSLQASPLVSQQPSPQIQAQSPPKAQPTSTLSVRSQNASQPSPLRLPPHLVTPVPADFTGSVVPAGSSIGTFIQASGAVLSAVVPMPEKSTSYDQVSETGHGLATDHDDHWMDDQPSSFVAQTAGSTISSPTLQAVIASPLADPPAPVGIRSPVTPPHAPVAVRESLSPSHLPSIASPPSDAIIRPHCVTAAPDTPLGSEERARAPPAVTTTSCVDQITAGPTPAAESEVGARVTPTLLSSKDNRASAKSRPAPVLNSITAKRGKVFSGALFNDAATSSSTCTLRPDSNAHICLYDNPSPTLSSHALEPPASVVGRVRRRRPTCGCDLAFFMAWLESDEWLNDVDERGTGKSAELEHERWADNSDESTMTRMVHGRASGQVDHVRRCAAIEEIALEAHCVEDGGKGCWMDALLHLLAVRIVANVTEEAVVQTTPQITDKPPELSPRLPSATLLHLPHLFAICCRLRNEPSRVCVLILDLCKRFRQPDPLPLLEILATLADAWPDPLALPARPLSPPSALRGDDDSNSLSPRSAPLIGCRSDTQATIFGSHDGDSGELVEAWASAAEHLANLCRASPFLSTVAWLTQRAIGCPRNTATTASTPKQGDTYMDVAAAERQLARSRLACACGKGWAVAAEVGAFPPVFTIQTVEHVLLPAILLALRDAAATALTAPQGRSRYDACAALELIVISAGPRWAFTHVVAPHLAPLAEISIESSIQGLIPRIMLASPRTDSSIDGAANVLRDMVRAVLQRMGTSQAAVADPGFVAVRKCLAAT